MSTVAVCRIARFAVAAGVPNKLAAKPEACTVPSLTTRLPVNELFPLRTSVPLPDLVTGPVPLASGELIVNAFPGIEPPV